MTNSIYIYSGEDTISLDKSTLLLKKNYPKIYEIENCPDYSYLSELFFNIGFFSEKRLFLFKNIFLNQANRGKLTEKITKIMQFLESQTNDDLLFIEDDLNKKKYYQKFLVKGKYLDFKLSPNLFYFLDNFYPKNYKKCFQYWEKAISSNAPELAFHMLKRRLKELILLSASELKGNYQPWQLAKLKTQLSYWEKSKLIRFYEALYGIEKMIKTGATPLDTRKSVEILLSLTL